MVGGSSTGRSSAVGDLAEAGSVVADWRQVQVQVQWVRVTAKICEKYV